MAASRLLDERDDTHAHVTVTAEDRPRPQTLPSDRTHPHASPSDVTLPQTPPSNKTHPSPTRSARGFRKALRKNQDYICIRMATPHGSLLPSEWWKTGMAFIWAGFNLLLTSAMITTIHERVPDKSVNPPLPDKFLDFVPRVEWAFSVTEVNGAVLVTLWFLQWLFLKHRAIVARRFFFLQGLLYLYRIVTMYITTLPVPSMHMECAPKLHNDFQGKMWRALGVVFAGGLSITNSQRMCGDFLYSGHAVMLTLTFLFIKEYSPRSCLWRCYHVVCWCLSAMGIFCILWAHEHYSVDVVVAYFITSRLFYCYHHMANNQVLKESPHNYLCRVWWSPAFNFLEKNVKTVVPCSFSWPVPLSSAFPRPCRSYSKVQSARDE